MTALVQHDGIDRTAILRSLNLNPADPKTQALLLVCERYELDPLLKHMVLISGNPYITRDGYLAIAHRSGVFDGMEVVEESDDDTHFRAKVAVFRKDMGRPFTYTGRFPKAKQMAKDYGPEMAVKVAEVAALRRAFNVTGVGAADERWDDEADRTLQSFEEPEPLADEGTHAAIRSMVQNLPDDLREQFVGWYTDQGFPPIKTADRLTQRQAEVVLDHIDELDKTAPAGEQQGPSNGPPGPEADTASPAAAPASPEPVVKPATNKPSAAARAALNGEKPKDKPALGGVRVPKDDAEQVEMLSDALGAEVVNG